jgi:hypothetical protein
MDKFSIPKLKTGVYEHYKGKRYRVLGTALHTETLEPLVIYKPLYKSDVDYWVRPYSMFVDIVEVDKTKTHRFKKID